MIRDGHRNPLARLYGTFTVKLIFEEFYLLGRSASYHLLVPTWAFVGPQRAVTVKGGAGHREAIARGFLRRVTPPPETRPGARRALTLRPSSQRR
jgi:hypothetical protein